MAIDVELSAILSNHKPDYDLFLLRWEIYRLTQGNQLKESPEIREFGSSIQASLKQGDYVVVYQIGGTTGEYHMSLTGDNPFKKQFDLNSGVIRASVTPAKGVKTHPDGVILCQALNRQNHYKWVYVSSPIAINSGDDLVLPAGIEFVLEGRIDEYDPERHTDKLQIKVTSGEIQKIIMIADKTAYF